MHKAENCQKLLITTPKFSDWKSGMKFFVNACFYIIDQNRCIEVDLGQYYELCSNLDSSFIYHHAS